MTKNKTMNAEVEPKESDYHHKGGNTYNHDQSYPKNTVRGQNISLRW